MTTTTRPVGELLKEWRDRRKVSQLDLAIAADISTRHLSFVETGRSNPSSRMILRLTEHLDVPLRERNAVLLAGGYAPAYPEHDLEEPEMTAIHDSLKQLLAGHNPYPAVVVDRHWQLVEANESVAIFLEGADPELLVPPINVLRLSLHPDGMAPSIVNLPQWRAHLLHRLRSQADRTADLELSQLYDELAAFPGGTGDDAPTSADVVVPLRYRYRDDELAFLSVTAVFGTPLDVTVSELAIESFFPADPATAAFLTQR